MLQSKEKFTYALYSFSIFSVQKKREGAEKQLL